MADLLLEYSLIDLAHHFLQCCRFCNLNTWSQVQQVTVLRSRCDYILRTDRRRFEIFGIRDMRNFSSDHLELSSHIIRRPTRCHARCLLGRRAFLLRLPPTAELRRADAKFQTLKTLEPVPPKLKRPTSSPLDVPIFYTVG